MLDPIPALKRQVGAELARLMQGWSTTDLYFRLMVDQPRVSRLRRQQLDRFSLESLIRYVERMGHEVTISVDPRRRLLPRKEGRR